MPTSSRTIQEALGESDVFLAFQERLRRVAVVDRPVLIIGERGTGKELAARRLHFLSKRWEAPLITLNCAALNPTLIEAELFGHEAGAFPGAARARTGRFEAADHGTLFLDEIGTIPPVAQEKILRVVEYGTFERVGSSTPCTVDVRIIGATNVDLRDLVDRKRFKADLLDRLSFEVLRLPPLRERGDDILLLSRHFAARMAHELGREQIPEFTGQVEAQLRDYAWPGNVRELKNVIERAVYQSHDSIIDKVIFDPFAPLTPHPQFSSKDNPAPDAPVEQAPETAVADMPQLPLAPGSSLSTLVADLEVSLIREALSRNRYNQRRAAGDLGLTYHQFRGLYRKYKQDGVF